MSLYNKYRPNTFENLIQSKFNKGFTKDSLTHHAYMFFGSPGTGKTSTSRLCMAEFLDDKEKNLAINGTHPDYIEVNCAVNNGVDDIRNIISDIINTMPVQSKYKFITFDECHMLTTQSQNALLKTVEEPPKHVKFFFCTTEVNKVLPAIRSRCQLVPFIKLNEKSLIKILENICKGENFSYNQECLKLISSCADGSARSAINLLEQCCSVLNDEDAVAQIVGTSSESNFFNLTKFICNKNKNQSLILLEEIFNNSIDPGSLMNKYADFIAEQILNRVSDPAKCEFEGKKLLIIADCVTEILKDFKILQNIKLISKINVLKAIEKM
jgi:DNA polymerase-3 subunit gamma/tau